jgi:hypothetical protein
MVHLKFITSVHHVHILARIVYIAVDVNVTYNVIFVEQFT